MLIWNEPDDYTDPFIDAAPTAADIAHHAEQARAADLDAWVERQAEEAAAELPEGTGEAGDERNCYVPGEGWVVV